MAADWPAGKPQSAAGRPLTPLTEIGKAVMNGEFRFASSAALPLEPRRPSPVSLASNQFRHRDRLRT
jgi:hypothetical protein